MFLQFGLVNSGVVHKVRVHCGYLLEVLFLLLDMSRSVSDNRVLSLERDGVNHGPVPSIFALDLDRDGLSNVLLRQHEDKPPLLRKPVIFKIERFHAKPAGCLLNQSANSKSRIIGRSGIGKPSCVVGQPADLLHHGLEPVVL